MLFKIVYVEGSSNYQLKFYKLYETCLNLNT